MPSKRSSVFNRSPEHNQNDDHDSGDLFGSNITLLWTMPLCKFNNASFHTFLESTSDESNHEGLQAPDHDIGYNLPRDHIVSTREQMKLPSSSRNHVCSRGDSDHRKAPQSKSHASDTSSAGSPPAHSRNAVPSGYDYATEMSELSLTSAGKSKSFSHFTLSLC
jgi:hypothetical protein